MLRLAKKEPVNGADGTTNDPSRHTSYRTSCGVTLFCGSNYFRKRPATGNGFELRVGQDLGSDCSACFDIVISCFESSMIG